MLFRLNSEGVLWIWRRVGRHRGRSYRSDRCANAMAAKADAAMQIVIVNFSAPKRNTCYVFEQEDRVGYNVTITDALPDGCTFCLETFGLTNLRFTAGAGIQKIAHNK